MKRRAEHRALSFFLYGDYMAQAWAKAFYNSKLWHDTREYILKRDHYRCQGRGCHRPAEEVHHIKKLTPENINNPMITVNPSNLISLCADCHKAQHTDDKRQGNKARYKDTQNILPEIYFDENGYPVEVKTPPGI